MKADTICCYHISKRMTKEAKESLHKQIIRARLTACEMCEVGTFLREILQLSKITPTPLF